MVALLTCAIAFTTGFVALPWHRMESALTDESGYSQRLGEERAAALSIRDDARPRCSKGMTLEAVRTLPPIAEPIGE